MMQDIMYLSTETTSVVSKVVAIALVIHGEVVTVPTPADEWPYNTVSEALKDGWRVVKFPELTFLLDESRNYGLGCEFILERLDLEARGAPKSS